MKRLVLCGLSTLMLTGAIAPAATAQMSRDPIMTSPYEMDIRATEAFNLVSLAYRGEFEEEGVPSYGELIREYRTGDITAEDVVEGGVEDGYISSAALQDEDYLNAVDLQLRTLRIGN
jgi:hypothetical protein